MGPDICIKVLGRLDAAEGNKPNRGQNRSGNKEELAKIEQSSMQQLSIGWLLYESKHMLFA